jgi:hypothetical protein
MVISAHSTIVRGKYYGVSIVHMSSNRLTVTLLRAVQIMGAGSVMVAYGMVYVNSSNWKTPNSSVLLAFSVEKDH